MSGAPILTKESKRQTKKRDEKSRKQRKRKNIRPSPNSAGAQTDRMTRRRGCLPAQKQTKYPAIPEKIIKYTKIRAPYCSHNPKSPADCPAEGRPTGCHRKP